MDLDGASAIWQALPEVREGGRPACAAQVGRQLDTGLLLALALALALASTLAPKPEPNPSSTLTQPNPEPQP